ncbi:hypothetical protein JCM10213v2_007696 [Rhodosporidiobolus nylandii]
MSSRWVRKIGLPSRSAPRAPPVDVAAVSSKDAQEMERDLAKKRAWADILQSDEEEAEEGAGQEAQGCTKEFSEEPAKPRARRAKLQTFQDAPLEVLLEIGSHLDPLTLLYLSRTSEQMHALYNRKASRHIRKYARDFIGLLDLKATDVSEARDASLLFERNCHACGRKGSLNVVYGLARRWYYDSDEAFLKYLRSGNGTIQFWIDAEAEKLKAQLCGFDVRIDKAEQAGEADASAALCTRREKSLQSRLKLVRRAHADTQAIEAWVTANGKQALRPHVKPETPAQAERRRQKARDKSAVKRRDQHAKASPARNGERFLPAAYSSPRHKRGAEAVGGLDRGVKRLRVGLDERARAQRGHSQNGEGYGKWQRSTDGRRGSEKSASLGARWDERGERSREIRHHQGALPPKPAFLPARPAAEICMPPPPKHAQRLVLPPRPPSLAIAQPRFLHNAPARFHPIPPTAGVGVRPSQAPSDPSPRFAPVSHARRGLGPQALTSSGHPGAVYCPPPQPPNVPRLPFPPAQRQQQPGRIPFQPPALLQPSQRPNHNLKQPAVQPVPKLPVPAPSPSPLPQPASPLSLSPTTSLPTFSPPIGLRDPPAKLSPGEPNPQWLEEALFGPEYGSWAKGASTSSSTSASPTEKRKGQGKGRKRGREEQDEEDVVGEGIDYEDWEERKRGRKRARP